MLLKLVSYRLKAVPFLAPPFFVIAGTIYLWN